MNHSMDITMKKIVFTDAIGMQVELDHADLVILRLDSDSIKRGRVGDAVDCLMQISDHSQYVERYQNAVVVMVDGYDHDPRELHQIPEVRKFMQAIDEAWPFAFHFFNVETESLMMFVSHLVDATVVKTEPGKISVRLDPDETHECIGKHFNAMNMLHEQHGVPAEKRQIAWRRIEQAFQSRMAPY